MSQITAHQLGPHSLHSSAAFEGFYTKFSLPSGASFIIVLCSVHSAPDPTRRHLISMVYTPTSSSSSKPWVCERYAARLDSPTGDTSSGAFTLVYLTAAGQEIASFSAGPRGNAYRISMPDLHLRFEATTTGRTPWSTSSKQSQSIFAPLLAQTPSPEGWLQSLPLPLHWHVHSLCSDTTFELVLPDDASQAWQDIRGEATAHEEKNWANGFPSAHVWCQARSPPHTSVISTSSTSSDASLAQPQDQSRSKQDQTSSQPSKESGICLAGGLTISLYAFLIGYRHSSSTLGPLTIDVRPPFAVGLPIPGSGKCLSPFLSFFVHWPSRTWTVDVANLKWRLIVAATGPAEEEKGWFHFSSPKPKGFVETGMAQTADGRVRVRVMRRQWGWFGWTKGFWEWEEVVAEVFEGAGVEFGGGYYSVKV